MTNTWTCTCSLTCLSSLNSVPQWTLPPVEGGVKRRITCQANELGLYSWILVRGVRRCESLYQIAAVDIGLRVYFTLKKPCSFVHRWDLCLLTQSNYKIVLLLHTIQYITIIDCIEKTWHFKLKRGLLQIN